ncbi:MAG: Sfum_1244 family protein [Desulfobacterales bacterium]
MDPIQPLLETIQANCDISDARYAGMFSVCGLALRLRDLHKWETGLAPWEDGETRTLLDWIGEREDRWMALAEREFSPLVYNGCTYGPFDTEEINRQLSTRGLFYGAGLANSLKPTFFLAPIAEVYPLEGLSVVVLGREMARDLLTLPAMTQDRRILFRKDSGMRFFWDQLVYVKKSGRPYLKFALRRLGGTSLSLEVLQGHVDPLFKVQREIFIRHEVGEVLDSVFEAESWQELIADHPHTPVELLARALKDLLADTHPKGTLRHLIRGRNAIALALYSALLDGFMLEIFEEFRNACEELLETGSWDSVEAKVESGRKRVTRMAGDMMRLHREGRARGDADWTRRRIEERLVNPFLKGREGRDSPSV